MTSGWEIASDILGAVSAGLLLIPAFGANKIARLLARTKVSIRKLRRSARPMSKEDVKRAEQTYRAAMAGGPRWSTWDEIILKLAAICLFLSFLAKGMHHCCR